MPHRLANFLAFQVAWFANVLGAANGRPWLGPLVVLAVLGVHLRHMPDPRFSARIIAVVGLIGVTVDSILGYVGILVYRDSLVAPWACPPWLITLWLALATTLGRSLSWLAGRPGLAAVLGGVFGPVSYYAGRELGALDFGGHPVIGLMTLSVVWAMLFPLLVRIASPVGGKGGL